MLFPFQIGFHLESSLGGFGFLLSLFFNIIKINKGFFMKIVFDIYSTKSFFYEGSKEEFCTLIANEFTDKNRKIELFRKDKLSLSAANYIRINENKAQGGFSKISLFPIDRTRFNSHLETRCHKIEEDFTASFLEFSKSVQRNQKAFSSIDSFRANLFALFLKCANTKSREDVDDILKKNYQSIKKELRNTSESFFPNELRDDWKNIKKAAKRYLMPLIF